MSCDDQRSLFDLDEPARGPGRRNPSRRAATRQRELQVHLPILDGEAAELLRLEDLAATQRPVTRGDCEQEARPCPWVSCPHHLYFDRFTEFEAVIDAIGEADDVELAVANALIELFEPSDDDPDPEGKAKRPKTSAAVELAVRGGRAMVTTYKEGRLRSDVLSSTDVRGPWPTCSLDVAQDVRDGDGDLEAEDTGRTLGKTRECVRLIELRARPYFAGDESLRPWLTDFVDADALDEIAASIDWFGAG